jgi:ribosomal protein S18 acetylase RimI-like enzyme
MTDKVHIRRATPSDFGFIVESNVAMASETEGLALAEDIVRPGVAAVLADDSLGFYLVAEVDGQLAGQLMVTFEWSDWRNGLWWWIQSVYVRSEFRRRGVYRTLHRHVAEAAQAAGGVCGLRLYVEQENTVAQGVYQSLDMHNTRYHMYEVEF